MLHAESWYALGRQQRASTWRCRGGPDKGNNCVRGCRQQNQSDRGHTERSSGHGPVVYATQEMMPTDSLPRRQLLEATERILGRSISIARLGQYLGAATFLADHL